MEGIDKEFTEQAYLYIQQQVRPNSRLNLALYNLFNTKNGRYRTDRIKNIGEAPHILDTPLVELSAKEIQKFLFYKGFFNAKVTSNIEVRKKKGFITFVANMGPMFTIREYTYDIADSVVKELYEQNRSQFTRISKGMRFDNDSLKNESQEIFYLLKKNGYYDYLQQYVRFETDTGLSGNQANLRMLLQNPPNRNSHPIYAINNTSIVIRDSNGRLTSSADSAVVDSQYFFKDFSLRFDPAPVTRYVFIEEGEKYNIESTALTYDRLYDLNVFKTIRIDYEKTGADSLKLNATIDVVPLKRMSNRVEGEYTFNSGRNGFNVGNTYTNRNLFGGAEQLDIRFRYGILFNTGATTGSRVFNRDFQIGANFIIPKLLLPFNIPPLGKNGVPHTTFSSSLQLFDQPNAFSNRLFVNSITYNWVETRYRLHSLTPLNIEFRDGRLDPDTKRTLLDSGYVLYVRTNDRRFFNLGSIYNYTLNAARLNSYESFSYFRGGFELAGNTVSLIANAFNFRTDSLGSRTFLGLPYLQYAKTDLDFRLYRHLGGERQFIARFNPGIVIPFGNTNAAELPFERNFFAGGNTGIRAWQARTLGPGNYNRSFLPAEARKNLAFLDQYGEIKLVTNLEYRFKIANSFFGAKLKGATFADAGNVWRLKPISEVPGGELRFDRLFKQIAIGVGAGLRFDLDYFVFRFDAGVKVKDPQFQNSDQWVIKHLFNDREFKEQYERTNGPDQYRFVQYNFGIGLPF